MTKKAAFRGSITALVTPFQDGRVDEHRFRALIDWQIINGTHGLVPVGTTGESPTLSHKEHREVIAACISAGIEDSRSTLMLTLGSETFPFSIAQTTAS